MNEQTHFFIKNNNLSHFILERVMVVVGEMSWRRGPTAILNPSSSLDHSSISFSSWHGVAQPWVTEGPKPSVCKLVLTLQHPVSNWLKPSGTWLYYCLMPTCFCCSSAYLHRCISWLTAQYITIFFGDTVTQVTFEHIYNICPIKKFSERGRFIGNN